MAISCVFGEPGCGKSSYLTLVAQNELKRIAKGKSKYNAVYTNFDCNGCRTIDFDKLGKWYYHDCLIILDELTLSADNRTWKTFPKEAKEFICLHRHFAVDIIYSVQDWSRAEKTIRENTVSLKYLSKFLWWVVARPVYRTITINEMVGELIQGYRFPTFIELLTGGMEIKCIKKAWKYYDSYDKYGFDELPEPLYKVWGYDKIKRVEVVKNKQRKQ